MQNNIYLKINFTPFQELKWDKNIYVYKISNINPPIEKHNNTYSSIDLSSIL
jgi:hypothetical protein